MKVLLRSLSTLLFFITLSITYAQPTVVPTYNCLGLYWEGVGGAGIICTTEYKVSGDVDWSKAQDLWWDARPSNELHGQEYRESYDWFTYY